MKNGKTNWTKKELQIYILLLCANADAVQTEEEIRLIKSKVDNEIFTKIYSEFLKDSEDESLEKIQENVALHHYSHRELLKIRTEMQEVFFADRNYQMMERNLERILRNMLY